MWLEAEASAPQPVPARPAAEVHFGGPDRPPRALRNLLLSRIEATPPGGEILWVTYYFRDMGLAEALAAAHRRGVKVRVALDARPRRADVNSRVIAHLQTNLSGGLRLHRPWIPGPRLHAKIYAFSGPEPVVFTGSFNPSGDEPEDADVLADIGDQDRGHNLLVEHRDPATALALHGQAERIWRGRGVSRLSPRQNRPVRAGDKSLYFYPRLRPGVVERDLRALGAGDRVQAAVSHLGSGPFATALARAAGRGAQVEVVVHDTRRRAPPALVRRLGRAGVAVRRYCHPEGLPMHAKFVLVRRGTDASAWFGSLNHNFKSRVLNHEVLLRSNDPYVVARLETRFGEIAQDAARLANVAEAPAGGDGGDRLEARSAEAAAKPVIALARDRACEAPLHSRPTTKLLGRRLGHG